MESLNEVVKFLSKVPIELLQEFDIHFVEIFQPLELILELFLEKFLEDQGGRVKGFYGFGFSLFYWLFILPFSGLFLLNTNILLVIDKKFLIFHQSQTTFVYVFEVFLEKRVALEISVLVITPVEVLVEALIDTFQIAPFPLFFLSEW